MYEKELDEIFGDKPNVSPVCTIGNNDPHGDQTVEAVGVDAVDDPGSEIEGSAEPEETIKAQKIRADVSEINEDSKKEGTIKRKVL